MGFGRTASRVEVKEVRCTACGALLATLERGALTIRRGDMQATFDGDFHASLVCYRPACRKLNVLRIASGADAVPARLGG